jgi:hypothetical protein
MKYTPEIINHLEGNEIFVFGTNQFSSHLGGAAKIAAEKFGALNGIAPMGLCQQSYGIITTSFTDTIVTLDFIKMQVGVLYGFAVLRPELTFYVTKIGTGIAGFSIEEIAGIFQDLASLKPHNIILPKEFTI